METMTKEITQVERLAEKMVKLKENVTPKDRTAASEKFEITKETISRYLNGHSHLMDADTAVGLIRFFEGRIADREKFI
jgi:hypothetical protein